MHATLMCRALPAGAQAKAAADKVEEEAAMRRREDEREEALEHAKETREVHVSNGARVWTRRAP